MSCRTNPSPIRFCTGDHGLAEPNRNHRLAPHNSASRQAPRQAQGARQTKQCQGNRRTPIRPNGAKANAGRSQGSPPGQTPATTPPSRQVPRQTQGARQTKQRQGTRRTPIKTSNAEVSTRRANPSGQATPDQAAPGIQTEIASPQGDRRFQLQRSGTISSGPLKKLRVSCVHERDGKQVPCVRSLCSYARESRAC